MSLFGSGLSAKSLNNHLLPSLAA